jgi:moderate conductance mechanosensitive channel
MQLLTEIATEVRNLPEYKGLFLAEPQILGVDAVKGSQIIFPVIFKTRATKQYGPMREFQRRVRLALEQNHLLPGDPLRVFNAFEGSRQAATASPAEHEPAAPKPPDPTTLKPQESNPFTGEG